jgi:hypothetical protein
MSCPNVTIQTISGSECIGDSLPKIVGNFNSLGNAVCNLFASVSSLSSSTDKFAFKVDVNALSAKVISLSSNAILKPYPAFGGQFLVYDYSTTTWVASSVQLGISNLTGDVTSVGNTTSYTNIVPSTKGGAGTLNGILKANGSGIVSVAIPGTDYVLPGALNSYATIASLAAYATNAKVDGLSAFADLNFATNARVTGLSSFADLNFATNARVTGLSSFADAKFIPKPASATTGYVLTWNGAAWIAAAVSTNTINLLGDITSIGANTTYNNVVPSNKGGAGTVNGIMKANGSGTVSAAVAGTDYVIPSALNNYATNTKVDGLSSFADRKFIIKPAEATNGQALVYNSVGDTWVAGTVGAGSNVPVGGGTDKVFWENDININSNYTITAGKNAGTFGPVNINNGAIVTIPNGSTWSIV